MLYSMNGLKITNHTLATDKATSSHEGRHVNPSCPETRQRPAHAWHETALVGVTFDDVTCVGEYARIIKR